ncbi:hypothetical protein BGW36DRAFT_393518 [Talaromyces proteolyticus]|uniref:Hemerythrin-like domain-containing protein n=1 Tax=Talaromyces proteolyticus TaxID=1131652 RepID=A0AAD4L052_9EURO|nr:uncharacterized protein BGW36DRAFT_393518 [Talaromyces proteolyticus]KAH8703065.1 hypothetical protein BGW36DRAFT_393518 [Talaromyces proteolyticus]
MHAISDTIKEDHRELEACYEKIDEKAIWQNQFAWELAHHLCAEELFIHPVFEKRLHNGKEIEHKDRGEHQTKLKKFQDTRSSNPSFIPAIHDLMKVLGPHIEEENFALPALEQMLSPQESDSMSHSFARTKILVPSRSHPSAPNNLPLIHQPR